MRSADSCLDDGRHCTWTSSCMGQENRLPTRKISPGTGWPTFKFKWRNENNKQTNKQTSWMDNHSPHAFAVSTSPSFLLLLTLTETGNNTLYNPKGVVWGQRQTKGPLSAGPPQLNAPLCGQQRRHRPVSRALDLAVPLCCCLQVVNQSCSSSPLT